MTQANIADEKLSDAVDELKKRLKLRDGGEHYIFATTRGDKEHILIISKKRGVNLAILVKMSTFVCSKVKYERNITICHQYKSRR